MPEKRPGTLPRVVFDSTILVSAFLRAGGLSSILLRHAAGGVFVLFLSADIISETHNVLLERPHLRRRYRYTDTDVADFLQDLQGSFTLITDIEALAGIVRDPNDDMIIACAVGAHADLVVTRDDDLLALGEYAGIGMVTPEDFMAMLRREGQV